MEYSRLLNRAWTLVWSHRFLILLGMLAALGDGGANRIGWRVSNTRAGVGPTFDFGQGSTAGIGGSIVMPILLIGVAVAIGLVLWTVTSVARGGLIAAVDTIENGGEPTFVTAWTAGWRNVWSLLGIGLLPIIPILILLIVAALTTGLFAGFAIFTGADMDFPLGTGGGIALVALACTAVPLVLALSLLHNFAERACILENLGVLPAYRRGWRVLIDNLVPAVVLFLIQIGLTISLGVVLLGPGILMALCFLLWPMLLLIGGVVAAYLSTLWTLAWREWTVSNAHAPLTPGVVGV